MTVYTSIGDLGLLELMARGREEAFTELYKRYWKKMLLLAWNHTSDKAHAEDIVHEVFLSLWERRNEAYIQNVPAYLATCIKFSIFKHYQREYRRAHLAKDNYKYDTITDDEEQLDALFLKEYINGIIEQLPEKCRLTFQYSRFEGLTNAEIALRMDISEKGVEANLTRALKVIRNNLKNAGLILLVAPAIWKDFF